MVLTLLLSTSTAQSVSTHTERQVGGGGNSSPIGTEGAEVTNRGSGFDNATGTSIALVILYSITGIITALFLMIIITGAVRAHRHPERYGPRAIARFGRPRQSRAKGLARAVLDTIPIVRIGGAGGALEKDAEIQGGQEGEVRAVDGGDGASEGARAGETETETTESPAEEGPSQDQCPVCMEDFEQGQEVRLLPCRHKFHPDCIDPWLLNVSGSCPLW